MPITIEIQIDEQGTVTGVRKVKQELDGLEKSAGKTSKEVSSLNSTLLTQAKTILPTLTAGWVAYKALGIGKEIMAISSRYETLGVVMNTVGKNAGYNNIQMREFQKGLEKTGISMVSSRQALTQMSQAQLDLAKSSQLARVAQDAAVIGNINSSEAFERMIYGIQSAQTEMLRTIGLNVNFQDSYEKVAKATGRATDSFSEAEKAAIRMNVVLEAGAKITGTYESAMETAGKQALSLKRYFEDFKVLMGESFLEEYATGIKGITEAIKYLNENLEKSNQSMRDQRAATEWLTKQGIAPAGTTRGTVASGYLGAYNAPSYTSGQIGFGLSMLNSEELRRSGAGRVPTSPGLATIPPTKEEIAAALKAIQLQFGMSAGYGRGGGMAQYATAFGGTQSNYSLGRFGGGISGVDASRTGGYESFGGLSLGRFGNVPGDYAEWDKDRIEKARKAAEEITEMQSREMEKMENQMLRMADFWGSMMERMISDSSNAFDIIGDLLKSLAIRAATAGIINSIFSFTTGGFGGGVASFLSNTFGFAGGGYTGNGSSSSVAGYVHRGEYVMPKPVVDQYGPGFFDRLLSAMKEGNRGSVTINQNFSPQQRREMMSLDDDAFAERIIRVARQRKI